MQDFTAKPASIQFLSCCRQGLRTCQKIMAGADKFIFNNPQEDNEAYNWLTTYHQQVTVAMGELETSLEIVEALSDHPDAATFVSTRIKHQSLEEKFYTRSELEFAAGNLAARFTNDYPTLDMWGSRQLDVIYILRQGCRIRAAYDFFVQIFPRINEWIDQLTGIYPAAFDADASTARYTEADGADAIDLFDSKTFQTFHSKMDTDMETIRNAMLMPHMKLADNPKSLSTDIMKHHAAMIDVRLQAMDSCLRAISLAITVPIATGQFRDQINADIAKARHDLTAADERFLASQQALLNQVADACETSDFHETTSEMLDVSECINNCYELINFLHNQARAQMGKTISAVANLPVTPCAGTSNATREQVERNLPPDTQQKITELVAWAKTELAALEQGSSDLGDQINSIPVGKSRTRLVLATKALRAGIDEITHSLRMLRRTAGELDFTDTSYDDELACCLQCVRRRNEFWTQKRQMETAAEITFQMRELAGFSEDAHAVFMDARELFSTLWDRFGSLAPQMAIAQFAALPATDA